MKEIFIKNGKVIFVDDADYEEATRHKWSVKNDDKYCHVVTNTNRKTVSYKKLILGIASPKRTLYKNRNALDLRRENIVVFDTLSEYVKALHTMGRIRAGAVEFNEAISKAAQGLKTHGKKNSEYIGVRLVTNVRQWQAVIKYAKQNYYLGSFEKEEYAALAYDKKAIELYGPDARVNFPNLTYGELTEKLKLIEKENEVIFSNNLSKRHQGRRFSGIVKTSKYVGISPSKSRCVKPWRATIYYQNKQHHIGSFYTEKDAALAYDDKAIELYGINARLNFPKNL